MFTEIFDDVSVFVDCQCLVASSVKIKAKNFASIVHASDKEVVLALFRRVPLYSPGASADVSYYERNGGLAQVK